LASSGGKVVKNVAGYDLPKLVAGAFGTLGVITRAIFRLHPQPKETRTISCMTSGTAEAQRLVLAIQNSQLAHSALQICWGAGIQPRVDVLFEGTEVGLAAQEQQAKAMMDAAKTGDRARHAWGTRQEICSAGKSGGEFAVAKFATLPAELAEPLETIARLCKGELRWSVVVQATGIGWVRLKGAAVGIDSVLRQLRANLEERGGSLVLAHRSAGASEFDAWGNSGDSLPLMSAVKRQFDPMGTLNPGRFVGGI
jgi:glycolate oxidase FAD binding subunit